MEKKGDHIVETAVEARGGFLGRPVLLVLVVSCAGRCGDGDGLCRRS
jgi:hypothetical protein